MKTQVADTHVVGIAVETRNADEISGNGRIPALWQRFFAEGVAARIPNRLNPEGVAVLYTDMESDETGSYRIIIGAIVRDLSQIPEGMIGRTAPAGVYQKFTSARGPLHSVVPALWHKIWQDAELKARRAFTGELELYDERASQPDNAELDILISLK